MKEEKSLSEKYMSNRLLWQGCMHGSYLKENETYSRTKDIVELLDMAREEGRKETQEWVSVEKELHELDRTVLVLTKNRNWTKSYRYKSRSNGECRWSGSYTFVNSITHWKYID